MNNLFVFIRKELMEIVRTKKFFILICVFAIFGMISPLTARYMKEILAMTIGDTMPIEIPPATWIDSWGQFYSNLSQMGEICIIFLFMGCVTGEKENGSASLTLTKNLSHSSFIISKFIMASAVFCISLFVALFICFGYTYFLFGYAGEIQKLLIGIVAYAVFTFTLLAVIILTSTLSQSTFVSAILAFGAFIILSISSYIPKIGLFLPGTLLSKSAELSVGMSYPNMIWTVIISLCIAALCLYMSILSLKIQEI